jgi:hypothetical protein
LKSQIVTSSWGEPCRAKPYAFTEQGVVETEERGKLGISMKY